MPTEQFAFRSTMWTLASVCLLMDQVFAQGFAGIARTARAEAEAEVRRRNMASLARSARSGPAVYRFGAPLTPFGFGAGLPRTRGRMSTAAKFSKVHGSRSVPPADNDAARIFQITSDLYLGRTQTDARTAASSPEIVAGFREALAGICPPPQPCNPFDPFRRSDGRCNNLFFPYQGAEGTPQPRLLPAAYEDPFQLSEPRLHGVGGIPLHSPRHVSNMVHQGLGVEIPEPGITLYLMQWGQFTDHDVVLTPIPELECAKAGAIVDTDPECLPIRINAPLPDPFFAPTYHWMNFVRSTPAINSGCIPGQRQHMNIITSYIDASNVYGSTREKRDMLRAGVLGRLLERPGANLPEGTEPCELNKGSDYCLEAGDVRVMEQPTLSMIHTVFLREHNRIATILHGIQPAWDDERLFQETRKIVAAEMQHITYNEYLPLLLGPAYTSFFGLLSAPIGFSFVYSPFVDASIVNVFAAASYRYGHSQVPNLLGKTNIINTAPGEIVQLEDFYFRPNWILKPPGTGIGVNWQARYTASANSQATDGILEQSVRNKLFQDGIDSLDLAALNIQRGRDHGLPPYNAYRVLCGRQPYLTWNDALADHTPENVDRLSKAYNDPRDIDMFPGALSEKPVPGGYLGPTNACIIGNQFWRLKRGDRFFYENPFPITGFTLGQLNSIKTTSLARIICRNTGTPLIQARVFLKVGLGNPLINCAALPDIDFLLWSGFQPNPGPGFHGPPIAPPVSPISALKFQRFPRFLVPNFPLGKGKGKPIIQKGPIKSLKI